MYCSKGCQLIYIIQKRKQSDMRNPMKTNPPWKPQLKVTTPANLRRKLHDVIIHHAGIKYLEKDKMVQGISSTPAAMQKHTCMGSASSPSLFFPTAVSSGYQGSQPERQTVLPGEVTGTRKMPTFIRVVEGDKRQEKTGGRRIIKMIILEDKRIHRRLFLFCFEGKELLLQ